VGSSSAGYQSPLPPSSLAVSDPLQFDNYYNTLAGGAPGEVSPI
jgi:hypothetical protein